MMLLCVVFCVYHLFRGFIRFELPLGFTHGILSGYAEDGCATRAIHIAPHTHTLDQGGFHLGCCETHVYYILSSGHLISCSSPSNVYIKPPYGNISSADIRVKQRPYCACSTTVSNRTSSVIEHTILIYQIHTQTHTIECLGTWSTWRPPRTNTNYFYMNKGADLI